MNQVIRHGDINFIPSKLPKGAQELARTMKFTAAEGETTGHCHVIESKARFHVFEHNGERYFVLNDSAVITHPEHKPLTLPAETYKQVQERETDWFTQTTRKVID